MNMRHITGFFKNQHLPFASFSTALDPSISSCLESDDQLDDAFHPDPLSERGGTLLFGTNDRGWIEDANPDFEVSGGSQGFGVPVIVYDNGELDDD